MRHFSPGIFYLFFFLKCGFHTFRHSEAGGLAHVYVHEDSLTTTHSSGLFMILHEHAGNL